MAQDGKINITGKNFFVALLIALTVAIVLTLIYTLMASFVANSEGNFNSVSMIEWMGRKFFSLFRMIGVCIIPVVFLIAFALLQRFRIK